MISKTSFLEQRLLMMHLMEAWHGLRGAGRGQPQVGSSLGRRDEYIYGTIDFWHALLGFKFFETDLVYFVQCVYIEGTKPVLTVE